MPRKGDDIGYCLRSPPMLIRDYGTGGVDFPDVILTVGCGEYRADLGKVEAVLRAEIITELESEPTT